MDSCLAGRQAPIRIKDKQYYKKLLDRYFGHNHALANENNSRLEKTIYRSSMSSRNFAARGFTNKDELNRQFPHVRLSYSSSDRKVVLTHEPYIVEDSDAEEVFELEVCVVMFERGLLGFSRSLLTFLKTDNVHRHMGHQPRKKTLRCLRHITFMQSCSALFGC